MNMLCKLFAAALILAPLAVAPASAHGSFHGGGHGGGHGGFGHGFGGHERHGFGHFHGWGYGHAYPSYGVEYGAASYCPEDYHFGEDGRCWPDRE